MHENSYFLAMNMDFMAKKKLLHVMFIFQLRGTRLVSCLLNIGERQIKVVWFKE